MLAIPADEVVIGEVYRNEAGQFDIRAMPNLAFRERPDHRFVVQTRPSARWLWSRLISDCSTAEKTREVVAQYLQWTRDPGIPH